MNAKKYLSQAFWLDLMIKSKLEQLEMLKSLVMKVTTSLSEEIISGRNSKKNKMENAIVKMISLEEEINGDIDRLVNLKKEIIETINQVDDIDSQVLLELRYVNGKGWKEVATCMGYDRRTIFRMHGKALKEIEKIKSCH